MRGAPAADRQGVRPIRGGRGDEVSDVGGFIVISADGQWKGLKRSRYSRATRASPLYHTAGDAKRFASQEGDTVVAVTVHRSAGPVFTRSK